MEIMTQKSEVFRVYINSEWVDIVFFPSSMTADEVRCSLIKHDGYRESIEVIKGVSLTNPSRRF